MCITLCISCSPRSRSRARAAPAWWSARISASCPTRCAAPCREFGLYHYKVLLFEKDQDRFRRPSEYVRDALATVTTHDMPTLRSFWEGRDIDLRSALRLYPTPELEQDCPRGARPRSGGAARRAAGRGPPAERSGSPGEPFTLELAHALHLYLARSSAALAAVQIEDLLGMTEPVNVPGTHHEYPNWQRKLNGDLEDLQIREDLERCFAEICRARH